MNLYADSFDEYSDGQTMVSPSNVQMGSMSSAGLLPTAWIIGAIIALVAIRLLQPYLEK